MGHARSEQSSPPQPSSQSHWRFSPTHSPCPEHIFLHKGSEQSFPPYPNVVSQKHSPRAHIPRPLQTPALIFFGHEQSGPPHPALQRQLRSFLQIPCIRSHDSPHMLAEHPEPIHPSSHVHCIGPVHRPCPEQFVGLQTKLLLQSAPAYPRSHTHEEECTHVPREVQLLMQPTI